MSTEDELRKAVRLALAQWAVVPLSHLGYIADAVLALPEMAALLADADNWRRATTGDPTEPLPLAEQARELLLRVRELEAQVAALPEWRCPSCGATTRARMADQ